MYNATFLLEWDISPFSVSEANVNQVNQHTIWNVFFLYMLLMFSNTTSQSTEIMLKYVFCTKELFQNNQLD